MSEINTFLSRYSYLDPLFRCSALNASPPFSGSALNASPLSTDANASARHETKMACQLPKPASQPEGWSSGGTARTRRRGVSEGGFIWAKPYAPITRESNTAIPSGYMSSVGLYTTLVVQNIFHEAKITI
ncbi:hypothetical protein OUZ56_024120 [Daphnia magna]|uniref:Uncharacterized protein n=1 Tax=Daphnia magna TaxID=35525 RepID=A0ABR0B079_9CRUS|nr:hypothetical protein OUZ56_024120 [Daphnia magna]